MDRERPDQQKHDSPRSQQRYSGPDARRFCASITDTHIDIRETHIIGEKTQEWVIHPEDCQAFHLHHIFVAGLSDATVPYAMARLRPPHLHLLVCSDGEGVVLLDGEWKRCGAGQAYICPPGHPIAYHALPRKVWKFAWVYYNSPAATKLYPGVRCLLQTADPCPFETILRGLHREIQTHRDEAAVALWVHLLHTACLRLLKDPLKNRFSLQSLWQLVEGNLAYPWNMMLLSKKAGMSEEHLRRLAWSEIGCSPMKHVAFLRMRHATLLLQVTSLNVSAVAEAVGYKNAFAFSTAFKRHIGSSPGAFLADSKQTSTYMHT
jgi:AraC-like DNA-binding protein